MVGITTRDTLPGDTIWEVEGSNPLLIARRTEEGYETFARSSTRHITPPNVVNGSKRIWHDSLLHCHLTFISLPDDKKLALPGFLSIEWLSDFLSKK